MVVDASPDLAHALAFDARHEIGIVVLGHGQPSLRRATAFNLHCHTGDRDRCRSLKATAPQQEAAKFDRTRQIDVASRGVSSLWPEGDRDHYSREFKFDRVHLPQGSLIDSRGVNLLMRLSP